MSEFRTLRPVAICGLAVVAGLGLSACSDKSSETGQVPADAQAPVEEKAAAEPQAVHWGYEGDAGPDNWAALSDEFSLCGSGKQQSPIDLTNAVAADGPSWSERVGDNVLTEGQRATVMDLVNNGHTIQITNDVPMIAIVDGIDFELVQYHFHSPSEHTVDGNHLPLEVHLVHKSGDGDLAVVGVLVKEGAHDPLWDVILSALPSEVGESRHLENLDLDPADVRPPPENYYRYMGSLTTPPCSENVRWIVSAEIREISPEQMATLLVHLHGNNRPVQPLNERTLQLYSPGNES